MKQTQSKLFQKQILDLMKSILILSTIIFICFSCTNQPVSKEKKRTSSSFLLQDVRTYESMIPETLKAGSLMIWRTGSIQWSAEASVLIFPKKNPLPKGTCYYIEFNFLPSYTKSNGEILKISNLNIKADLKAFYKHKIKAQVVEYVIRKGEGYCANQYFIKESGSDSMYLINSDSALSKETITLFRQISPQEHFQTYSLYPNCKQYRDSSSLEQLFTKGKNKEGVEYKLPFVPPIRYGGN